LGAVVERSIDTKLIAATQTDLSASVSAGRFRADLYHRLAVVVLTLPPVRERGNDILGLARHFLRYYGEVHRLPPKGLSRAAEAWLLRYDWPGNVRELSHLMERVTLLSPDTIVAPESLERLCLPRLGAPLSAESTSTEGDTDPPDEPTRIRQALVQAEGNVMRAARLLGLGRGALRHRMRRYGIRVPRHESLTHASDSSAAEESFRPRVLPWRKNGQTKLPSRHQNYATDTPGGQAVPITASDWARKPVTILAINVTFPEPPELEAPGFEPWTVAARWQQHIEEKVNGFGGLLLQRSPSLLVVAFGLPRTLEPLRHGLATLQAAEFLYETLLFPEREYTFKHALTHEVAYGSLPQGRRRMLTSALWRPWKGFMPTAWTSRSTGWRTMPCVARCGTKL
jgi:hypothetical protein